MGIKTIRKRFKLTRSGKMICRASHLSHNLTKLSGKAKRLKQKPIFLAVVHSKKIKKYL